MNILAFDTTMGACSAAVLRESDDAPKIVCRYEERSRGHAEALMPMIGSALEEAGLAYEDISRVAVTRGPGTFTGVRVGVAAARALALATGAELVAADTLHVMALGALDTWRVQGDAIDPKQIAIATDARRDQVYFALHDRGGRCLQAPAALAPADASALIAEPQATLLAGSGAQFISDELKGRDVLGRIDVLQPDARFLCALARILPTCETPPSPLYLRPPDAKPQADAALPRR